MANEKDPKKVHPDHYLAMHSPRGANASFALGAMDSGGGFLHDVPFVPEQEVFIGLKRGNVITCLPFFKKEEVNLEEAYDIGAAKKKLKVELKKYQPEDVVRRYGMATDTWAVPGLQGPEIARELFRSLNTLRTHTKTFSCRCRFGPRGR